MDDTRRFTLVGRHSSPRGFERYVLKQLLRHKSLTFTVIEDGARAPLKKIRLKKVTVHDTQHEPNFWINASDQSGKWFRIDAASGKVYFDIYPG